MKYTAVTFGTDHHETTVLADEDDVATISVGGRMVVGLSLGTGHVGVWLPGDADDEWVAVHHDSGHPYPQQDTPGDPVEAARVAYVAALRAAGDTDLADLIDGLDARTHPQEIGNPGDTSPRYLVDLFGLVVDVRATRDGLVVDLRADELDEKYQPVNVNLGTNALTDDGRWTKTFGRDGR